MKWEGEAMVLEVRKFSERDAIVTIFSHDHGLYRGFAKNAFTKKQRGVLQSGNLIYAKWNARLEDQMGSVYSELLTPYSAIIMQSKTDLAILSISCLFISKSLMERDPHPNYMIYFCIIG